jgi:hypothetical protein
MSTNLAFSSVAAITLSTAATLVFPFCSANAFEIAQECKQMKDPIGCTCAIQNGGKIQPVGSDFASNYRWVSKLNARAATSEAFVQCQIKARGHK